MFRPPSQRGGTVRAGRDYWPRRERHLKRLFANEQELTLWLADNLALIEPGLHLFGGRQCAIEYQCRISATRAGFVGVIDILAEDAEGGLVAIECKGPSAKAAALGQVLGYVTWLEQCPSMAGRRVRGFVVALSLSRLIVATQRRYFPQIALFHCPKGGIPQRFAG